MEAYYVMTYGAKSRSLPLLPPLFENNEAGGDFLAKEALDAVKDAEPAFWTRPLHAAPPFGRTPHKRRTS